MDYRMNREQTLQYIANLRNESRNPLQQPRSSHNNNNRNYYKEKELPPPPDVEKRPYHDKENTPDILVNRCAGCGIKLEQNAVTASNNQLYHVECFACVECGGKLLESTPVGCDESSSCRFYTRGSKLYCYNDYHRLFSPRCAGCNETIIDDDVLQAMDKTWHKNHFYCTGCKNPFPSDMTYIVQESMPWCDCCYKSKYGISCWKCGYMIPKSEPVIDLFDRAWCNQCFSCQQCLKSFPDNKAILRNDGTLVCLECEQRKLKQEALSTSFS